MDISTILIASITVAILVVLFVAAQYLAQILALLKVIVENQKK